MADPKEPIDIEEEVGTNLRLNDAPGLGMLPDGKLNVVQKGMPRFDPELAIEDDDNAEGSEEDDFSDLDDIDDLSF
jgi:hypothetical protein